MSTTTEPTAQTGTPGQQGSEGQGSTPPTQPQGGITFTAEQQAHIDRLIADRLARQKATIEGQTRAEREKAEREAAEAKAREQGEYQKLAETEKQRADKAEQEKADAEHTMRDRLIRTEIKAVAATLGFAAKPEVLHRLVDFAAVEFNEQGDPTNVEALLKQLAKDEPYLVGGGTQGNGRAHIPATPNGSTLTEAEFKRQEEERMRGSGRYAAL